MIDWTLYVKVHLWFTLFYHLDLYLGHDVLYSMYYVVSFTVVFL